MSRRQWLKGPLLEEKIHSKGVGVGLSKSVAPKEQAGEDLVLFFLF